MKTCLQSIIQPHTARCNHIEYTLIAQVIYVAILLAGLAYEPYRKTYLFIFSVPSLHRYSFTSCLSISLKVSKENFNEPLSSMSLLLATKKCKVILPVQSLIYYPKDHKYFTANFFNQVRYRAECQKYVSSLTSLLSNLAPPFKHYICAEPSTFEDQSIHPSISNLLSTYTKYISNISVIWNTFGVIETDIKYTVTLIKVTASTHYHKLANGDIIRSYHNDDIALNTYIYGKCTLCST